MSSTSINLGLSPDASSDYPAGLLPIPKILVQEQVQWFDTMVVITIDCQVSYIPHD